MRPSTILRFLGAAAVVATTVSCGGDRSPTSPSSLDLPTDFPITVTSGTTPTISWTGENATSFSIQDMSTNTINDDIVWDFSPQSYATGFASPVRYGTMPTGAACGFLDEQCPTARALVKGHQYLIIILTVNNKAGEKSFTP